MLVAGCARSGDTLPAPGSTAVSGIRSVSPPRPAAGRLPTCPGQDRRKGYVQTFTNLKVHGGALCIGRFRGFGGSLEYPSVDRSVKLTNRLTITNLYNQPEFGSGAVLLYLNLHFHDNTRFGATVAAKGGLESNKFTPGQSYTAFGQVAVGHLVFMFTPCYSVATSGANGGLLPNIGALFDNAIVTGNGFGVIEIYPGAQVSQECEGTSG
jgi:hypothetical protein